MHDGTIVFSTKLDNKRLEKDLDKQKTLIEKSEREIEDLTEKRDAADKQSVFSAAELDAEKAKLAQMKKDLQEMRAIVKDKTVSPGMVAEAKAAIPGTQADIADQQARVRMLQAEYNKVDNSVKRYNERLQDAEKKLRRQQEKAGEIAQELASVSKASQAMARASAKAEKNMQRFGRRLREVIRSALVFTLITRSLAKFREWMGKVLKTNDKANESIARLKGALLTLAQPLVEVIIPAVIVLTDALTKIVLVLANLFSRLTGSTLEQSKESAEALNKETEALEGVGAAAEGAEKSLASFDEINQLGGKDSTSDSIAPSFDFSDDKMAENSDSVAGAIAAIGAAFATWKISDAVLGWFDKLGDGKFNNAHKVSAGLAGIAASFGLMSWHYDQLVSGELDPNSIKSQLVSALETALGAISGVLVLTGAGVGLGVAISIALPVTATIAKLVIELSDDQGQAAVSNFKRTLEGLFAGEDWGTIVKDFVFGEEKEKTFWEKISGVFSGTNLHNNIQNNLIDTFKNLGSEEYVKTLDMSVGQRITYWMQTSFPNLFNDETGKVDAQAALKTSVGFATDPIGAWLDILFGDKVTAWMQETFPGLFSDKTAEERSKSYMEGTMDNTFAPAGWWLGRKLGERIEEWMRNEFPGLFNDETSKKDARGNLYDFISFVTKPLGYWLDTKLKDPVKKAIDEVWKDIKGLFSDIEKYNPNFTGYGPDYSWMFKDKNVPTSSVASGFVVPRTSAYTPSYISDPSGFFAGAAGALQTAGGGTTETTVVLEVDKRELGRVTYKANGKQNQHVGVTLED